VPKTAGAYLSRAQRGVRQDVDDGHDEPDLSAVGNVRALGVPHSIAAVRDFRRCDAFLVTVVFAPIELQTCHTRWRQLISQRWRWLVYFLVQCINTMIADVSFVPRNHAADFRNLA
jgi:hypothetical protein